MQTCTIEPFSGDGQLLGRATISKAEPAWKLYLADEQY